MPLFYELFITFAPKLYHCVVFNDYEIEILYIDGCSFGLFFFMGTTKES